MSNQPDDGSQQEDDATHAAFPDAMAVYFAMINVDGPNDARLLYDGLKSVQGVLQINVFFIQGIAVVIYNRPQVILAELCRAVEQIGTDTSPFFGADVTSESAAREALQSK